MLIQHLPLLAKKHIILASASPRRAELLQGLGLKAVIIPSTFVEDLEKSEFGCLGDYATETAKQKALEVSKRVENGRRTDLVIGADTVVELDGIAMEKPRDKKDAFRMLSSLSGRQHTVYTGVALVLPAARGELVLYEGREARLDASVCTEFESFQLSTKYLVSLCLDPQLGLQPLVRTFWEETKVEFAKLEKEAIDAYISSGEPMDKAGAYGIQGIGGSFVKSIKGCYFNVMGFPVHRFSEEVDKLIKEDLLPLHPVME